MQVLLINPPWEKRADDNRARFKVISCLPSLGLGYIAACLEKEGVGIKILDLNVNRAGLKDLPQTLSMLGFIPQFIGITSAATTVHAAKDIAGICKRVFPDAKVVMGGVQPTVTPEMFLESEHVDYVVRGEGEVTIIDLVVRGEELSNIKGLSYKKDGKLLHNPDRLPIANLDEIPFPSYHLFQIEKYHPPEALFRRLPAINIITSRGCPFKCTYCATQTIWPGKLRMRSIENVIEELKVLTQQYGIREISFSDDTLPAIRSRMVQLCEAILKNKIDITWSCNAIVKFVDEDVLRLMKKAGCHHICYGVESVDEQILKNIHKNIKIEEAEQVIKATKKAGIACRASFMFGNPGETVESMQKTLEFTLRTKPDFALFNITTPYPGTPMYNWAKENGYLLSEDLSLYTASRCLVNLPTVSPAEVEEFTRYAWKKFYRRPGYIIGRLFKIRSIHDIRAYSNAFFSLLKI
ncbi:MAG: radical SAM protein [Deltaproteobacteria bacterium]|nr:radical SAM protein [Deltaproteobacteria bacterium]